jgi:CBS domain-containing protein
MLSVKQLLNAKPHNFVWAMRPEQTVYEALELMAEKNCGAIMIMDGPALIGIFSERDYARRGIIQGRKAKSTPLSEVMTGNVFTVQPDQNIEDCMALMSSKHIRHLPVVNHEEEVMGLLSISDIVTAIIREQEGRIQSLEQYITGY